MTLPTIKGAELPPLGWQHRERFDPAKIQTVISRPVFPKPCGGLWTAPVLKPGHTTWTEWCKRENYGSATDPVTVIAPDPEASVYVINNQSHLMRLEAAYPSAFSPEYKMWALLDWEAMATDLDAVWLTGRGERLTRFSTPGLYGWDVETVLWLQPKVTGQDHPDG